MHLPATNIYPVITLYQPWATWIVEGWKTIETRTHDRFKCLVGKTILIHAGATYDQSPFRYAAERNYLSHKAIDVPQGCILGRAYVSSSRILNYNDAHKALIECDTKRYGLFLREIVKFENPIYTKGQMGIWYYDMSKMQPVLKLKEQIKLIF